MGTKSQSGSCPKCGAPIAPDSPQGLCPRCLLAQASSPTEPGKDRVRNISPPSHEELASAFPQLEVLELVGQGGMGFVYKARQPKIERIVALKILPQSLASDPEFAERFTQEGRMLARLNHPNIVTLYDFGQTGGFFYLLMEFVDGVNLRQAMKVGRFTAVQALSIVPRICEALEFAHREGILHRDIKPENILLDSKGRVKIADFGIAKLLGQTTADRYLTTSGALLGTPQYMAPEQLERSQEVDQRADIYSLGVVFYEMLTGELPIGRFQPPSEKVQVDVRLDEVVLHALEKEPSRRYQRADEVRTAVETIASTPAPPPETRATVAEIQAMKASGRGPVRFWKPFVVGVVSVILLLIGLAVLSTLPLPESKKQMAEIQPATAEPTNQLPAPAFGRVIELTVNRASLGSNFLINLKTGELHTPPAEVSGSVAVRAWAERSAIDAGVGVLSGDNNVVSGFDMAALPAPTQCWDELTPMEAAARLEGQPASSFGVLLYATGSLPETSVFRTREGHIGILQLTRLETNPPGVTIRYKCTEQAVSLSPPGSDNNAPWSPKLFPGEEPDLAKVLEEATQLTATAHFEEALQRYQWHLLHAQESDHPGQNAVQLVSGLTGWAELGRRYPRVREALTEVRDKNTRVILAGHGHAELFRLVQAINRELQEDNATYELFRTVRRSDPKLAAQCWFWLQDLLVAKGEYQWLMERLGNPQTRFDLILHSFDLQRSYYSDSNHLATAQPKAPGNPSASPLPGFKPAIRPEAAQMLKQSAETRFVGQTCQLVEILCGAGRKADAESIREQALAVLDNPRLRSAVTDAETRVQQHSQATRNP